MEKSLDVKIAKIRANPASREFILADAKDPDMAYGMAAPGKSPEHYAHEGKFRSLPEFRECIRQVVHQGLVDIMLMSAHTSDVLTIGERLFDNTHVTPAGRANDTTDIHFARASKYGSQPSRPFRTAFVDHLQCGHLDCEPSERRLGVDLVLYSITFSNNAELDRETAEAYRNFREEAERKQIRHFLEVFDPNVSGAVEPEKIGPFINDMISRTLAGVPDIARPLFLKMVYHGPKPMEELAGYDPSIVIGILGGGSGTTYDAFKLIAEAQKYGAKVALFGRKINNAEHQLAFIECLRRIVDGQVSAEEAVRVYHGALQGLGIKPYRTLDDDMALTNPVMSYASSSVSVPNVLGRAPSPKAASVSTSTNGDGRAFPRKTDGAPDFAKMTPGQRANYHKQRLARL